MFLPGFSGIFWVSNGFLPGFSGFPGFYWAILPGVFVGSSGVFAGFDGISRVLSGFRGF